MNLEIRAAALGYGYGSMGNFAVREIDALPSARDGVDVYVAVEHY